MSAVTITQNQERNGIELRFNSRPAAQVLEALKTGGFRWSSRNKLWYARRNDQTLALANAIASGEGFSSDTTNNLTTRNYDLWELTRTDSIGSHFDGNARPREIAASFRAHVKPRFPMCRFSVTSDYDSVSVSVKSSPFEKDSDELNAVFNYLKAYLASFNHREPGNPYQDYHDCHFYGFVSLAFDYRQTEITVAVHNMREDFQAKQAAFEQAEAQRRQREYEAYQRQQEIEAQKREAQRKVDAANRQMIEASARVVDGVDYFVNHLVDPGISKLNTVAEYFRCMDEEPGYKRETRARVSREVHMSAEHYALFRNMLLHDWAFIAATGGSETQDQRVNSRETGGTCRPPSAKPWNGIAAIAWQSTAILTW